MTNWAQKTMSASIFQSVGKRKFHQQIDENAPEKGTEQKKLKLLPSVSQQNLIDRSLLSETEYIFQNGLRYVKPYIFTFQVYAKRRWYNRPLIEVLAEEFRGYTYDYYKKAIHCGRVRVNGEKVDASRLIQNGDKISHTVHRHEPPVTAEPIKIIHETDEILVVNKPGSIPIHPTGRFRHNTVVFILAAEKGYTKLHLVHRLDRLTSGLLLLAKTSECANRIAQQIKSSNVRKEYIAKVIGNFPEGYTEVDQPIASNDLKRERQIISPKGKPSRTGFEKIKMIGDCSIVKCIPYTGRTHQIRVHLQYLGFPIVNDPIYNPNYVATTVNDPELDSFPILSSNQKSSAFTSTDDGNNNCNDIDSDNNHINNNCLNGDFTASQTPSSQKQNHESDESVESLIEDCIFCKTKFHDPKPEENFICLHAYSYKSTDPNNMWEFKTEMPSWSA